MLKKLDILVLIFAPLLAAWISLATHANFLTSIFLFFTLPSVWFSLRTPTKVKKTLSFATVISIPMALIIDYFATGDQSWHVTTIFSFRVLGTIPLEDFFIGFFAAYYAVIFYEHFLDKGKHNLSDKRLKYLLWPLILISILIITASLLNTSALVIPYAYLWIGITLVVIPSLSFILKYPKLLSKYLKTGAYFFLLYLIFEFTGLELGQWTFPGDNFIGWIEIFKYRLPVEEFIFWICLTTIAVLSYYEFFGDDRR